MYKNNTVDFMTVFSETSFAPLRFGGICAPQGSALATFFISTWLRDDDLTLEVSLNQPKIGVSPVRTTPTLHLSLKQMNRTSLSIPEDSLVLQLNRFKLTRRVLQPKPFGAHLCV